MRYARRSLLGPPQATSAALVEVAPWTKSHDLRDHTIACNDSCAITFPNHAGGGAFLEGVYHHTSELYWDELFDGL